MASREELKALYHDLKGVSRMVAGELTIEGFLDPDYETLFVEIVDRISNEFGGNYEYFYNKWARSYYAKFLRDRRTTHGYCPQVEKPLDLQTVREQLVVLKYFLMRRTYSRYSK